MIQVTRDELVAAIAFAEKEILGLGNYLGMPLSAEARAEVTSVYHAYARRRDLLVALLAAFDALDADGYPTVPVEEVSLSVQQELQKHLDAVIAAFDDFELAPQATQLVVTLGQPQAKE